MALQGLDTAIIDLLLELELLLIENVRSVVGHVPIVNDRAKVAALDALSLTHKAPRSFVEAAGDDLSFQSKTSGDALDAHLLLFVDGFLLRLLRTHTLQKLGRHSLHLI